MYRIRCSPPLRGEAWVATSKNASLPQMAAVLLTREEVRLQQLPELTDIGAMRELLLSLRCRCETLGETSVFCAADAWPMPVGDEAMRRMRASILVMGPLLARFGRCRLAMPGGCAIGMRPIDLHVKGFVAMGAEIRTEGGSVVAEAKRLRGATVVLDLPSVGATENLVMAACLAEGVTRVLNAAREPEVVDLCRLLRKMGARIEGEGTDEIRVEGAERLGGAAHQPISDRIEAGTLMLMASYPGADVLLRNADAGQMNAVLFKLREAGAQVLEYPGGIRVRGDYLRAVDIRTLAYPGFPTDMQSVWLARMATAAGVGVVTENLFENRYRLVEELCRMGARIRVDGRIAVVTGMPELTGASVVAPDLRAGAALLTAALHARGETHVHGTEHIRRGYDDILRKMRALGALAEEVQGAEGGRAASM